MTNNSRDDGSNSRAAGIMLALAVGLLAGAAGALLLAPGSGGSTRRRIGEFAGDVVDRAGRITRRAGDVLKEQAGRVDEAVADGKQAYRQTQENLKS